MKPNDVVALLLRSPFHALLGNTMLIKLTGRKSGKPIITPVNYAQCGNHLWVLSSRNRTWWRNIQNATLVSVHMQGRDFIARADLVTHPAAVAIQLLEYARLLPAVAGPLGLRSPATAATTAARLSVDRLFVHVQIDSTLSPARAPGS